MSILSICTSALVPIFLAHFSLSFTTHFQVFETISTQRLKKNCSESEKYTYLIILQTNIALHECNGGNGNLRLQLSTSSNCTTIKSK